MCLFILNFSVNPLAQVGHAKVRLGDTAEVFWLACLSFRLLPFPVLLVLFLLLLLLFFPLLQLILILLIKVDAVDPIVEFDDDIVVVV